MENHPIPQDVTGFKFKLIGSVTVKQFLYLLGFGILTTVAFVLPVNIFLKVPMMLFFASIGVSLAFVPIEGRPMDIMLVNFAKAIPSENRYLYRKRGVNLAMFPAFAIASQKQTPGNTPGAARVSSPQDEKKAILLSRLRNSPFRPDEGELEHLASVKSFFDDNQGPSGLETAPGRRPVIAPLSRIAVDKPEPIKKPVNTEPKAAAAAPADLKKPSKAGFPSIPDTPNVILGQVLDPRGKPLQNILVEVVDSSGVPVRAFKTNSLGQFAAATQLQNGTYKISFEDPAKNHEFETIEVTLNGEIFNPLEITSTDAREKLRRELFGSTHAAA